ncbi:unnamed protein product [Symbiodinium sp. CCMP2592]|nr:unnamed protein product [Symbiodinium sp. CCMP2592]
MAMTDSVSSRTSTSAPECHSCFTLHEVPTAATKWITCRSQRCLHENPELPERGKRFALCRQCLETGICPQCGEVIPPSAVEAMTDGLRVHSESGTGYPGSTNSGSNRFSSNQGSRKERSRIDWDQYRNQSWWSASSWGGGGWDADWTHYGHYTPIHWKRISINPRSVGLVVGKGNKTLDALKQRPGIVDVKVHNGGQMEEAPWEGQGTSRCFVEVTGFTQQAVWDVVDEVRKYESRHKWGQTSAGAGARSLHIEISRKRVLRFQAAAMEAVAADFSAYKQERDFYTISHGDRTNVNPNPGRSETRARSFIHVGPNLPGLSCLLHELQRVLSGLPDGEDARIVIRLGCLLFSGLDRAALRWSQEEFGRLHPKSDFQTQFSKFVKDSVAERIKLFWELNLFGHQREPHPTCESSAEIRLELQEEERKDLPKELVAVLHDPDVDLKSIKQLGRGSIKHVHSRTGRRLYADLCFAEATETELGLSLRLQVTSGKDCAHVQDLLEEAPITEGSKNTKLITLAHNGPAQYCVQALKRVHLQESYAGQGVASATFKRLTESDHRHMFTGNIESWEVEFSSGALDVFLKTRGQENEACLECEKLVSEVSKFMSSFLSQPPA